MGVITGTNNLTFKSSDALFARIKKRLHSFDANALIDDGDFGKAVVDILSSIGIGVLKECQAVLPVTSFKTKLPANYKYFHAAYRSTFKWGGTKSINEQRPWIYYQDVEITQQCPQSCTITCQPEYGKNKIVIRTFVNGDEQTCSSSNPCLLKLSPNVSDQCTVDSPSLFCSGPDEITIDDDRNILTNFDEDSIYIQYYGLPVDEYGLPLIPDEKNVEKAIEYGIYAQLFEEWYWNTTVPGIGNMLADARQQADYHLRMAQYWANLPSFQTMVDAIRKQRGNKSFYNFTFDKTVVN